MYFKIDKISVCTLAVAIAALLFLNLIFEPWLIEVLATDIVKCD